MITTITPIERYGGYRRSNVSPFGGFVTDLFAMAVPGLGGTMLGEEIGRNIAGTEAGQAATTIMGSGGSGTLTDMIARPAAAFTSEVGKGVKTLIIVGGIGVGLYLMFQYSKGRKLAKLLG